MKIIGIILALIIVIIPINVCPVIASDAIVSNGTWELPPLVQSVRSAIIVEPTILQESEYYYIPISEDFITKNGNKLDAVEINLTFPESWLTNPPNTLDNSVILRVPKSYVSRHDTNKSPDIVTATFFHDFFQGIPKASPPPSPEELGYTSKNTNKTPQETRNIEFEERWYYQHSGDDITGAAGYIYPSIYTNSYGETFLAYQEIEFVGDTWADAIEVVCAFDDGWQDHTKICFGVWVNGSLYFLPVSLLPVNLGNYVYWDFEVVYGSPSYYDCNFYIGGNTYSYTQNDSTPPSDFYHIQPSSEIDTEGGIDYSFTAYTSPLGLNNLKTTSWQGSTYVPQVLSRFDYNLSTYVYTWCYLGSNSLQAYLRASDTD